MGICKQIIKSSSPYDTETYRRGQMNRRKGEQDEEEVEEK